MTNTSMDGEILSMYKYKNLCLALWTGMCGNVTTDFWWVAAGDNL